MLVEITFNISDRDLFSIVSIKKRSMIIRAINGCKELNLVRRWTRWMISGETKPYSIIMLDKCFLTGMTDIDSQIIANCDIEILKLLSITSQYTKSIVLSTNLWQIKSSLISGGDLAPNYISVLRDICLKIPKNKELIQFISDKATMLGHTNILDWINKRLFVGVDRYILDIAAAGGHLNILKWWNHRCIYPTSKGINNAIINNHLELAKWAVEHIKIRPNHIGANGAMACGNVIALKWLHSIGVRPSAVGANLAAANGYIMALEWSVNTLDMYPNNFRIAIKN